MKCLKCLNKISSTVNLKVNKYLDHLSDWGICDDCLDITVEEVANKVHEYYVANKDNYRKLHIKYKGSLVKSYVANAFVDRTVLKAIDIPDNIVEAKRQYMKTNRIIKESK